MLVPACAHPGAPDQDSLPCPPTAPDAAGGFPRLVEEGVLSEAFEALDAVIQCESLADVSPPGTEGFAVYELVAAARERLARVLGVEL